MMKFCPLDKIYAVATGDTVSLDMGKMYALVEWRAIVLYDSLGYEMARNPRSDDNLKVFRFQVIRPGHAAVVIFYE